MKWTEDTLNTLDKQFRTNLINSLSGYKSVNLIGTQNSSGKTNLALFSSVVHLGADPALIGIISRPDSVPRHTLDNIKATGFYTINHATESMLDQAHQTSARYEQSEFDATGLTPECEADFSAPFVKESPVKLGVELKEIIPIRHNGTYLIVGKIVTIQLPSEALFTSGNVDLNQLKTLCVSGLDTYHLPQKVKRLGYAKPDKKPESIEETPYD